MQRSKPVLCEKPLAATVAQCRQIVELEQNAGRRLIQVGFMRRFDPAYVELKSAYERGVIGPGMLLRCVHRNASEPGYFSSQMSITNAMVHEFDISRWLLGSEIRRIRVTQVPYLASDDLEGSARRGRSNGQ